MSSMLGSSWGSTTAVDPAVTTTASSSSCLFGMPSSGSTTMNNMSDASPPTDGDADFHFLGPPMAAVTTATTATTGTTTNLDFFDTMAGGTYVNWMHEFEALNGYDWASTADMNGTLL